MKTLIFSYLNMFFICDIVFERINLNGRFVLVDVGKKIKTCAYIPWTEHLGTLSDWTICNHIIFENVLIVQYVQSQYLASIYSTHSHI